MLGRSSQATLLGIVLVRPKTTKWLLVQKENPSKTTGFWRFGTFFLLPIGFLFFFLGDPERIMLDSKGQKARQDMGYDRTLEEFGKKLACPLRIYEWWVGCWWVEQPSVVHED